MWCQCQKLTFKHALLALNVAWKRLNRGKGPAVVLQRSSSWCVSLTATYIYVENVKVGTWINEATMFRLLKLEMRCADPSSKTTQCYLWKHLWRWVLRRSFWAHAGVLVAWNKILRTKHFLISLSFGSSLAHSYDTFQSLLTVPHRQDRPDDLHIII